MNSFMSAELTALLVSMCRRRTMTLGVRRRQQARPRAHIETRQTRLVERYQLGHERGAIQRGHAQGSQLAGANLRACRGLFAPVSSKRTGCLGLFLRTPTDPERPPDE